MIEPATVLKWETFRNEKRDRASILLLHCTALNKCQPSSGELLNFTINFLKNQQANFINFMLSSIANVMQAYGFTDSDDDILAKVLELNLELAEKEKRGEPVVGLCVPTD
ncbi:hypothetical protein QUA81_01120 [Microcoleus sp. F6_B4]